MRNLSALVDGLFLLMIVMPTPWVPSVTGLPLSTAPSSVLRLENVRSTLTVTAVELEAPVTWTAPVAVPETCSNVWFLIMIFIKVTTDYHITTKSFSEL